MPNARYFRLRDDIGIEPPYLIDPATGDPVANPRAGELQPLQHETLSLGIPTMVDDELVNIAQPVTIPAIPGTRILKIDDPLVANGVAALGKYDEIDAPTKRDLDKARKETEPARERPASGNPDDTTEE